MRRRLFWPIADVASGSVALSESLSSVSVVEPAFKMSSVR